MQTINISLPLKLKSQAEELIKGGYFASFSDLVRHSLRSAISQSQYDLWAEEAKQELKQGKATVLKSDQDIDKFIKDL